MTDQAINNYPKEIFNFYIKKINRPYQNHIRTKGWVKEVINQDSSYHRKIILENGQANFNSGFNQLTPEEKVTLYCNYYLQMHAVSGYYVLQKCEPLFKKFFTISNKKICFIDFGCGALTSGISLAWSYLNWNENYSFNGLKINYLGIDTALPMINKAKYISSNSPELFTPDIYKFDFIGDFAKYNQISDFLKNTLSRTEDNLVILNFSYFFASESLDVEEIIDIVGKIINNFGIQHQIVLLFQNPQNYKNKKWQQFRNCTQLKVVFENEENIKYKNTTSAFNERQQSVIKEIKLKYAVMTDRYE